jgi:hypothetical protein
MSEYKQQVTSQIDLESIDDKSKIVVFVKHPPRVNLKELYLKNYIILVKNATRKVH